MALDQALLETTTHSVLRTYRWAEPTISFGYSQSLREVRENFPNHPLVRRWTGGGIVSHQGDWTFALICPSTEPLAALRPEETYRLIHACLVEALDQEGIGARLVRAGESRPGAACFTAPALHDVFDPVGEKICGGAQRRTRQGFLHQGSLQGTPVSEMFARGFAAKLAGEVREFCGSKELEERAEKLARGRYGSAEWLEKIL